MTNMSRSYIFVISAIFMSFFIICDGLECYHCYSGNALNDKSSQFVPCNELKLNESNTYVCPDSRSQCIWEVVEIESTKARQTWRTCSNPFLDPCNPGALPPGTKMVKCTHCNTDKCNLYEGEEEQRNNTFTFNINANVNLYIRQ